VSFHSQIRGVSRYETSSDQIERLAMTAGTSNPICNTSTENLTFTGCAGKRSVEARYEEDIARGSKEWGWK
jgi:hypothetical protein